ncbi:hypothetical protein BJF93_02930 [Xaviernesmea oryzae]|uniref:Uncharacterized protein n=1 Tax=Xaviernesmea oryzae TaxID=464029 RepID=A0A1Q9AZB7_9HYPH|nr:hypothetical protein [Xaviernesmea oryzae]OLP61029.1 hypothetical protein BJF93_02930 [Xaviernesmea oryzae]SEL16444.1 hypothetical protein SAMN04487976_106123 [Xaviernesmea oryzae]
MTKHPKTQKPGDTDLTEDPGVGRTRGLQSRSDDELLQGENTVEGDTANDTTPEGGVDPSDRGRINK